MSKAHQKVTEEPAKVEPAAKAEPKAEAKPKTKKGLLPFLKKHLLMEIGIPVIAVIILLLLILIKVPYQAKESYTELESYEVTTVEPDPSNVINTRICEYTPAVVTITENSAYGKYFGLSSFKCYGSFRITNQANTEGPWAYRYVFNFSGKTVTSNIINKTIPILSSLVFNFESMECKAGDDITGYPELVGGPLTPKCQYVPIVQNKTVVRTQQRPVQKERLIIKYEPLWQSIMGYNSNEKA